MNKTFSIKNRQQTIYTVVSTFTVEQPVSDTISVVETVVARKPIGGSLAEKIGLNKVKKDWDAERYGPYADAKYVGSSIVEMIVEDPTLPVKPVVSVSWYQTAANYIKRLLNR